MERTIRHRSLHPALSLALLLIATAACPESARAQAAAAIDSAASVVQNWSPDQHLYIKGDLGVSRAQFSELEAWLRKNGPHWTIVLMESAEGERYSEPGGQLHSGMDAVEYALGHGLANRTGFGRLEHPRTGETDGCVFVLFLRERKFSYYASDAQDRRGLGESRWIGELDRPAVDAMRNGGRIIDAVRNTVSSINGRLARTIEREEQTAREEAELQRRAALERQRAMASARDQADAIRNQAIPGLEADVQRFRGEHPDIPAALLANPPVSEWTRALDEALARLDGESVREVTQAIAAVGESVRAHQDLLAAHRAFPQTTRPLRQRLDNIIFHASAPVADSASGEAEELLRKAEQQHRAGDPEFSSTFSRAVAAVARGEELILAEEQRLETERQKRQVARRAVGWTLGGLGGIGLLGLGLLNWRRRPALRRAFADFDRATAAVTREQQQLAAMLERRDAVLVRQAPAPGGWQGRTAELAEAVQRDCAALERMSGEAQRVLARAGSMLHPGNPLAEAVNMISATRYLACSNLLAGPSFSLAVVDAPVPPGTAGSADQWVSLTEFAAMMSGIRQRAEDEVVRLEQAIAAAGPGQAQLAADLDEAAALAAHLAEAARSDGYLALPELEQELLPELRQIIEQVGTTIAADPLETADHLVPRGQQVAADALGLARAARGFRTDGFPALDQAADQLRSHGRRVAWIEEAVVAAGKQAGELLRKARSGSISAGRAAWQDSLQEIASRAARCSALAGEIDQRHRPAVAATETRIAEARRTVATALGLSPDDCLAEPGFHPGERVEAARRQQVAAESSIDRGDAAGAEGALQTAAMELTGADALAANSLQVLQQFPDRLAAARLHEQQSLAKIAPAESTLDAARQRYAATALRIPAAATGPNPGARTGPDDGVTLQLVSLPDDALPADHWMSHAITAIRDAAGSLQQAGSLFQRARILEADQLLQQTGAGLHDADAVLQAVVGHCQLLDRLAGENLAASRAARAALDSQSAAINEMRTRVATQKRHQELAARAADLATALEGRPAGRDPIADSVQLATQRQEIEVLQARLAADRAAFAEAALAVQGAARELAAVRRLVDQSQRDQIPDSSTIQRCIADTARLASGLDAVDGRLRLAHQDWEEVQAAAARLNGDLGVVAGTLVRELQLAEQAAADFRTASQEVFRAAQWTGSYGIRVNGEPGSDRLEQARRALATGDYNATIDLCRAAASIAVAAIRTAEAQVEQRRREIAAAAEAERRRRAAATGAGIGIGSRIGGGSSSSGRSWSSGGSSRSSGSGSGFSRSGW